jgi:hypothetical protein
MLIRPAARSDDDIWRMFRAVMPPGDICIFDPDLSGEEQATGETMKLCPDAHVPDWRAPTPDATH